MLQRFLNVFATVLTVLCVPSWTMKIHSGVKDDQPRAVDDQPGVTPADPCTAAVIMCQVY
jgi:hypothetical protein